MIFDMKTAIYNYRLTDYQGGYTAHSLRVEIIGESEKSYRVRYLEPGSYGAYVNTVKWVRKRNISNISDTGSAAGNVRRTPHPEEIRLPYKD